MKGTLFSLQVIEQSGYFAGFVQVNREVLAVGCDAFDERDLTVRFELSTANPKFNWVMVEQFDGDKTTRQDCS